MNIAEGDDEVIERDQAELELLVAHQQLAEAVEPAMADFDHPPLDLLIGIAPLVIGRLAAIDDVTEAAAVLDGADIRRAAVAQDGACAAEPLLDRPFYWQPVRNT